MRYVAAYLLASLGGKSSPTAKDVKKILDASGVDIDTQELQLVIDNLSGKDLEELMEEGKEKLATVPSGGGGAPAAGSSAGGAAAAADTKQEEKKPETESESDDDMGFGLFD